MKASAVPAMSGDWTRLLPATTPMSAPSSPVAAQSPAPEDRVVSAADRSSILSAVQARAASAKVQDDVVRHPRSIQPARLSRSAVRQRARCAAEVPSSHRPRNSACRSLQVSGRSRRARATFASLRLDDRLFAATAQASGQHPQQREYPDPCPRTVRADVEIFCSPRTKSLGLRLVAYVQLMN